MGLRISHDAYSGSCGTFNEWRAHIAKGMGIEDLQQMCYYRLTGGEAWDTYADDPLTKLMIHSDHEGIIKAQELRPIIDRLKEITTEFSAKTNNKKEKEQNSFFEELTDKFIKGSEKAIKENKPLKFRG